MSGTGVSTDTSSVLPDLGTIDMKLEVVTLPVSDVDRAKRFYQSLGWRTDADIVVGDAFRAVQLTPHHSSCSIAFGKGLTTAPPGSVQRLELVVDDIDAAREDLITSRRRGERGVPPRRGARPGPGPATSLLHDLRLVQRSRRQRMAAPGDQDRDLPAGNGTIDWMPS